jgi:RND family efflux transporter MFP subunit
MPLFAFSRISAGFAGSLFCVMALAQSPAAIRISDAQLAKAGVVFAAINPASVAGEGIRLAGSAVYPPSRIEIVSAPAAGVVQAVLINSMDKVKAGSTLVRLHSPALLEWQREYVQLETQLGLAIKKAERDESLFNDGIIAASRLQETRNQLVQSRVAVQERTQMLQLAGMSNAAIKTLAGQHGLNPALTVKSTLNGTVLELMVAAGQRVEAGAPLAKLARSGELWLELQASRAQGEQIKAGDLVRLSACKQAGQVTAIAPQMAEQSQLVIVRASLPGAEQCLRAGQYVEASISSRSAPQAGWQIPAAALVRQSGREFIFVRDAGGVKALAVQVISRGAEQSIVSGALQANMQVATQGTANLKGIWLGLGAPKTGAQ